MSDAVQKALQKAASRAAKLAAADTCAEQGELEGAKETKKDKRLKEAKAHSRMEANNPATGKPLQKSLQAEADDKLRRGVSSATTVPATEEELVAMRKGAELQTPPPKRAKLEPELDDEVANMSAPKETMHGRSPTLHYSPTQGNHEEHESDPEAEEHKIRQKKKAAVKSKPKNKEPKNNEPKNKEPPNQVSPKVETPPAEVAKAVQATLARASTVDLKSVVVMEADRDTETNEGSQKKAQNTSSKMKKKNNDDEPSDDDPSDGNSEGVTADDIRKRREVHARYMRFSRSLKSSSRLAVLFEQWVSCSGHWTESSIYLQMKIERRHRTIGSRRWMTLHELSMKYGSRDVALKIQAAKESDPEYKRTQIRPHPDAPDDDDLKQYLVYDADSVEDTTDEVTSNLFAAVDRDREDEGKDDRKSNRQGTKKKSTRNKKKSKKKKAKGGKKKSSSSSSSDSSESSETKSDSKSSDSSEPAKKKKKAKKRGKKSKSESPEHSPEPEEKNKNKKAKTETEEEKQRKEQEKKEKEEKKELEKKAKQVLNKRIAKTSKIANKVQQQLLKASSVEVKAQSMSAQMKQLFLSELVPHRKKLQTCRDTLEKIIAKVKEDSQTDALDAPETDADDAVLKFQVFLTNNNMK